VLSDLFMVNPDDKRHRLHMVHVHELFDFAVPRTVWIIYMVSWCYINVLLQRFFTAAGLVVLIISLQTKLY
jgi:hypothetical protein